MRSFFASKSFLILFGLVIAVALLPLHEILAQSPRAGTAPSKNETRNSKKANLPNKGILPAPNRAKSPPPTQPKTTDSKPADAKPTEPKTAEPKTTDTKPNGPEIPNLDSKSDAKTNSKPDVKPDAKSDTKPTASDADKKPTEPKSDAADPKKPKLIFIRSTLTPGYGQGNQKTFPVQQGTVLQVREERKVDGEQYYVTVGGIIKASDVLVFENATKTIFDEIREAEKDNKPTHELIHLYGLIFHKAGRFDEAIASYSKALDLLDADAKNKNAPFGETLLLARADSLIEVGKIEDAMRDCDAALAINPKSAIAVATRALAMYQGGKLREAFDEATKASKLDANVALPYLIQGWVYDEKNFPAEAIKFFEKALAIDPVLASARNSMAWVLATTGSEKHYNPKSALEYARNACEWDAYRSPQFLDTLAVVYAANGDFANAAKTAQVALEHASAAEKPGIQSHLELFKNKKAYRSQKAK